MILICILSLGKSFNMCSTLKLDERDIPFTRKGKITTYKGLATFKVEKGIVVYEKDTCPESTLPKVPVKIVEQYAFQCPKRGFSSDEEILYRKSVYDLETNRLLTCFVNISIPVPYFVYEECNRNIEKFNKHIEFFEKCKHLMPLSNRFDN